MNDDFSNHCDEQQRHKRDRARCQQRRVDAGRRIVHSTGQDDEAANAGGIDDW